MDTEQKPPQNPVDKCVKFFKTLINLTQKNQQNYVPNAPEVVRKFNQWYNSAGRVYNVRAALLSGTHSIEGIRFNGEPASDQAAQSFANGVQDEAEANPALATFHPAKNGALEQQPIQTFVTPSAPVVSALSENMPYSMLDTHTLINKLVEQVPECEGIEQDVVTKIAEAAEDHLRQLLAELSEIAAHRTEPLRMNTMYQQINDPRKQLRFVEEHEKQVHMRQEAVEKEALMKSAKTKAKDNGLKAKDAKNANQEEKMFRDANDAALKAVGKGSGASFRDKITAPSGMGVQKARLRIRRANLSDLLCLLECKNPESAALIKKYSMYGLLHVGERGDFGI
ncbi:Transcription initiation factor TFIID subunit 4 [Aphelenchoides bicaudatus]|nr:Transcription initiation factor TFIID subunit 4 [Aphelenchoides bicaudatus]